MKKIRDILRTQRLEIRPYQEADIPALAELLADKEISQTFILPDYKTREEYERMANRLLTYSHSDAHFERGIYRGTTLIGFVNDVQITHDALEIGYVIHPCFQGQGYATEMLRAVIAELFSSGFHQITAASFEGNIASIRVMQKCGMSKAEFCDSIDYHGKRQPCVYYEIRANESNSMFMVDMDPYRKRSCGPLPAAPQDALKTKTLNPRQSLNPSPRPASPKPDDSRRCHIEGSG